MNIIKLQIVLLGLLCFSFQVYSQITFQDSLQLYYPFDSNADDESGNGLDAVVNGALHTTDRLGNIDAALDFDGVDDWLNTNATFDYQYRTISVWANPDDITGAGNTAKMVLTQDALSLTYGQATIKYESGDLKMKAGGENNFFAVPGNVGVWTHIVLVRNDPICTYYVNGAIVGNAPCGNISSTTFSNPEMVIGVGRTTTSQFFDGKIDDIRIYNRVLTGAEIQQIYTNQVGILDPSLNSMSLQLSPNPMGNTAILSFNNIKNESHSFFLFDSMGRVVRLIQDITSNKFVIEKGNLASGVYYYQLKNDRLMIGQGKVVVK